MKRKILTIAISLLCIMSSCGRKPENNKDTLLNNILSKYEQPDNTKKIITSRFYPAYLNGECSIHTVTYYDEYDNILLKKWINNDGSTSQMCRVSYYNAKDSETKEIVKFSFKDSTETVTNVIRNDKGHLRQIIENTSIVKSIEYDETGKKIREEDKNNFTVFTYFNADSNKEVIKCDNYKNTIGSNEERTPVLISTQYEIYNVETDKIVRIEKYVYDEQEELTQFIEYKYEYDKYGNNVLYIQLARSKYPPFIAIPRDYDLGNIDEYQKEYNKKNSLEDFSYISGLQKLYVYDDYGNCTKEIRYNLPEKELSGITAYDYEYDKNGNWIKRIQKFVSQPENEITEGDKEIREIIYL